MGGGACVCVCERERERQFFCRGTPSTNPSLPHAQTGTLSGGPACASGAGRGILRVCGERVGEQMKNEHAPSIARRPESMAVRPPSPQFLHRIAWCDDAAHAGGGTHSSAAQGKRLSSRKYASAIPQPPETNALFSIVWRNRKSVPSVPWGRGPPARTVGAMVSGQSFFFSIDSVLAPTHAFLFLFLSCFPPPSLLSLSPTHRLWLPCAP